MQHTFYIQGMTCKGYQSHVEELLSNVKGVSKATVDLDQAKVSIEMEVHIPFERFEEALNNDGDSYSIHNQIEQIPPTATNQAKQPTGKGTGLFYCPMHCEGDKTYETPGDCPVCGMDLIEEQKLSSFKIEEWTCPMHPKIVQDRPGSCPVCGMDLVPLHATISAEEKTYKELLKKFKIAVAFTLPVFIIAMSDMLSNNPLLEVMEERYWIWTQFVLSIPVVFYVAWMFFVRAWKSLTTWNLNMFTLIGIGSGVAWLFSVFGMFFPDIFPSQFKTESGAVHIYFEAATVILTLVLLGQLLEARAHSKRRYDLSFTF